MKTILLPSDLVDLLAPALGNAMSSITKEDATQVHDLMLRLDGTSIGHEPGTAIIALMATLLHTLNQNEVGTFEFTMSAPKDPELN